MRKLTANRRELSVMTEIRRVRMTEMWAVMALSAALVAVGLIIPTPSEARTIRYIDRGHDPNDVPVDPTSCCQQDPDIRSTTRTVWVDEQGRRWPNRQLRDVRTAG